MTQLAYHPQRLSVLAIMTRAAADDLLLTGQDEPYCEDAASTARGIAADLEELLRESLRTLLLDRSMIEWFGSPAMTVDEMLAALTAAAPTPEAPFVLDGGQFSLAAAITAGSEVQWQHVVDSPLCVGFEGTYDGGGFITDHCGVSYPIVVPQIETADGQVFTADWGPVPAGEPSVATLGGTDPGWEVVGSATGVDRFQERPSLAEGFAGFLAGTTGIVGPLPPNSGLAYIRVAGPSGVPSFADAPTIPASVIAPPAIGAPDPGDNSPGAAVDAGASLVVTGAQGGVMAAAMDNQTQRAYQVIFEKNADERRRAGIQTYTLAHDGQGGVSIIPEHVWVDADGDLMSETISYGQPFAPDYLGVVVSGDVASFAFSGDEPCRYEVPRAVFP